MPSPSELRRQTKKTQTVYRLIVVVVGVGLLGLCLVVLGNSRGRIDVSFTNSTGKPLRDVAIGVEPADTAAGLFARVGVGETVRLKVPSAENVVVRLKDGDGRDRRAEYPFERGPGLWHTMKINVTASALDASNFARRGRTSVRSSSALLGGSVQYVEPIDQFEDVAAPSPK
jgi:hypothetical protein